MIFIFCVFQVIQLCDCVGFLTMRLICIYRCTFIVVSDRNRFAWKTKMAVLQMIGIYLFSIVYSVIPFVVWIGKNERISECSHIALGKNSEKIFVFLGVGFFLPIVILHVLYLVTSCKLRKHWRKRMRFSRREDSFAKENSGAETSTMCHINQQRRDERGGKIKFCDSQKHRPQDQVLLDLQRSAFRDSFNIISHMRDDTKRSDLNVKGSFICQSEANDGSFDLNNTPSALLATSTSFEPTDLNTAANPEEGVFSVKTTALPKCEITHFENISDPFSTRRENTPKRLSHLNRVYKSDFQRQSLCLIGLILLLIDVSIFSADYRKIDSCFDINYGAVCAFTSVV